MSVKVEVDYSRDKLLDTYAIEILKERYMLPTEKSPQDAFARAACAFSGGDWELSQRIYDYTSNLWLSFSTPVLSNGGTDRGLPISCYLNSIDDSRTSIFAAWTELGWLSSKGGGIGTYYGRLRSNGTKTSSGNSTSGVIPFVAIQNSITLGVQQGSNRRGAAAVYLDVSHPELQEFLNIRRTSGGAAERKALNLFNGINLCDKFMSILERSIADDTVSDDWGLVDPHTEEVVSTVSAKNIWKQILELRMETGTPYLHFVDTTNRLQPECHKQLGLRVHHSNLCTEIVLPTNEERTAVCCLSSVNLEYYEEWRDTTIVQDVTRFLDNVLTSFTEKAGEGFDKAVFSVNNSRDIGIGALGFHAYLQRYNIPFESAIAVSKTREMFSTIKKAAEEESTKLGEERGYAPDMLTKAGKYKKGARRNVHLMAVAPNATSSIICGNTSPSVEPYRANAFSQRTLSGTHLHKNPYLQAILVDRCDDVDEVWKDIVDNGGSVQHLDMLSDQEKLVFKTAIEIDQNWIIELASHRQEFIDQAQSINLFFEPDVDKGYLHNVHMAAYKRGLKTLYYCRSESIRRPENVGIKIDKYEYKECISCE